MKTTGSMVGHKIPVSAALLIVLLVSVMCVEVAAGRYLPTRSDNSRRDRIKDILRMILEAPAEQNRGFLVTDVWPDVDQISYPRSGPSGGFEPLAKREVGPGSNSSPDAVLIQA